VSSDDACAAHEDPADKIRQQLTVLEELLDEGVDTEDAELVEDVMEQYSRIGISFIHSLDVKIREKHPEKHLDYMRKCSSWLYLIDFEEIAQLRKEKASDFLKLIIDNLGKASLLTLKGKDDLLGTIVKTAWIDLQCTRTREGAEFWYDVEKSMGWDDWSGKALELADYKDNEWKFGEAVFDYLFHYYSRRKPGSELDEDFYEVIRVRFSQENPDGFMDEISWESSYHKKCPFIYSVFYPSSESRRAGGRMKEKRKLERERDWELETKRKAFGKEFLSREKLSCKDIGSFLKDRIDDEFKPIGTSIRNRCEDASKLVDSDESITDGIFKSCAIKQITRRIRTYA